MLNFVDNFLNNITMYRLTLYYLIFLNAVAGVLSFVGLLPFGFFPFIFSLLFVLAFCWVTNKVFAIVFEVPVNVESVYITALILVLVLTPFKIFDDLQFLAWAPIAAISGKFIFSINRRHIFNPAAFGIVVASFATGQVASWWVGTLVMAPFVFLGGLLVVRKIRRFDLVLAFFVVALAVIFGASLAKGTDVTRILRSVFLDSPILFFAFVMLTEPLTTPAKKIWQVVYGLVVGLMFVPQIHFGAFYTTPELALLIGNIFSYAVSGGRRALLKLKEKAQMAQDTYGFTFVPDTRFSYTPGQYLEWTVPHSGVDSRGNRRYFTLSSSPTEAELMIGVKFYQNSSSFKKALGSLLSGDQIFAGQLAGEFTLPVDQTKKLVFIAGGIGITPYRSMIKFLLDKGEKRPITLLYSNKKIGDIVYKDIFDSAVEKLGIKTVYTLTDPGVPQSWTGKVGFIDQKMIQEEIPDWKDSLFYISGPHSMVNVFEKVLKQMGIGGNKIKIDFFPGFV